MIQKKEEKKKKGYKDSVRELSQVVAALFDF